MTRESPRQFDLYGELIVNEYTLAFQHPELVEEWNYEKNGDLEPEDFKHRSSKKVWWICKIGHEWDAIIADRSRRGQGCPYCYNENRGNILRKALLEKSGSLAEHFPEISSEWDYKKNEDLTPNEVSPKSGLKVWWKCEKKHSWQARIADRHVAGCPYCSGRRASARARLSFLYLLTAFIFVF